MTDFILIKLVELVSWMIPTLGISPELTTRIDAGMALVLGLIMGASYILPLDVIVLCFSTIMIVDNWGIVVRIVKWVISILPFT